ncbi:MAG: NADH-quinone oxidoreductase subunit NuoE [Chloroflexi bacterium]|nr:NADH-quinone oxidoreductase subunit NuoE [Chloroflexota bacterium]
MAENTTITQSKETKDLLILLAQTQKKCGFLSEETLANLARTLDMSLSDVYGVATFYSFLSTKPLGRHVIRVCKSLPCHYKDAAVIIESLEKTLGIKTGETTPDGRFSLELTNCIGACDKAPAILINDDVHGDLTVDRIPQILQAYK